MGLLESLGDFFENDRQRNAKIDYALKQAKLRSLLGQESAQSKLLGGPDPNAADPTASYAPIMAPTGFTPAPNVRQTPDGANNLSDMVFNRPKQIYQYAEPLLGKERDESSGFSPDMAIGLMNGGPDAMARVRGGLLGQADPGYGMTMARISPMLQNMTPSQRMAFQLNPDEAAKKSADAAFPTPTDYAKDLAASGILPGTPEFAKAMEAKRIKDTYVRERDDPLYAQNVQAGIAEKGAQAELAKSRVDLLKNTGLDEDAINMRAEMWAAGDQDGAFKGIPNSIYGSPARQAISAKGAQLAQASGRGGAEQAAVNAQYMADKAGMRTAGQAGAKMDTLATEVQKFADLAQKASSNLPRGSFVPLTKAEQMIQAGTSSPELAEFVAANTSLVNAYSAVAGRGTPTVAGQEHAYKMLSTAMSPQAYEATVKQLIKETEAAKASPGTTMEDIRGRITQTSKSGEGGKSVPASQAAESSPPPKPISVPSGSQYSPSLKQWRDPSGTIYDAMGQKVQ